MKSKFYSPKLSIYGDVSSLTKVFGSNPTKDSFIFNGTPSDVDGSGSVIINTTG
jgi:hypothetical protein